MTNNQGINETFMKRCDSVIRGKKIEFYVNGNPISAYQGETMHTALLASGYLQLRKSKKNHPRSVFCGMGVCYDCLITINGMPNQRACMTTVTEGAKVVIDVN
jgi:D-hydroxyproline dehydrogenase subunit gamma